MKVSVREQRIGIASQPFCIWVTVNFVFMFLSFKPPRALSVIRCPSLVPCNIQCTLMAHFHHMLGSYLAYCHSACSLFLPNLFQVRVYSHCHCLQQHLSQSLLLLQFHAAEPLWCTLEGSLLPLTFKQLNGN